MAKIYLAKKPDGSVVYHASLNALREIDGIESPGLEIDEEEFSAAGNLARIIGGEIFIGKTDAEKAADEAARELEEVKKQIADRDYRALKAMKLGQELDALYPGESAWYEERLARVHELEEVISGVAG